MSTIKITLKNKITNNSIQVGDTAYFITPTTDETIDSVTSTLPNGFVVQDNNSMKEIGKIKKITTDTIHIDNPTNTPSSDDFIMFSKIKSVNNSSLLGYYAEVKLNNNSMDKVELFSLSSEIAVSSK